MGHKWMEKDEFSYVHSDAYEDHIHTLSVFAGHLSVYCNFAACLIHE